jgi:CheY-like chemotaxis protein
MLRDAGHETLEAADGRAGLKIVLEQKPDCILSDLLMPEMDGISFLAALRSENISLPVIVISADIQETKRQQCLSLGAFGFINKPPQRGELLRVVDAALQSGGE